MWMISFGLGRLWQQGVKKDRERRDFRVVSVCDGRQGEGGGRIECVFFL